MTEHKTNQTNDKNEKKREWPNTVKKDPSVNVNEEFSVLSSNREWVPIQVQIVYKT